MCYWAKAFPSDTLAGESTTGIYACTQGATRVSVHGGKTVIAMIRQLLIEDRGQDVAEYAVMLAVILVIVIGTVRLIGGNANNVFNQVQSSLSQ
jgi:Flp pilus assembly pilin Flp